MTAAGRERYNTAVDSSRVKIKISYREPLLNMKVSTDGLQDSLELISPSIGRSPLYPENENSVLRSSSMELRSTTAASAVRVEWRMIAGVNLLVVRIVISEFRKTVLGFDYGHLNPPYYASKGESDDDEPILTCFLTMKHHTEFSRKSVIPYANGMKRLLSSLTPANCQPALSGKKFEQ